MKILQENKIFKELDAIPFTGEIKYDSISRHAYATDASAYRELPLAVAYPKNTEDIAHLIRFARKFKIGLIPRATGTSLAGQTVGNGVVVDISKHLNKVLEVNVEEKWVRVEPGVVLDELNMQLKSFGLFFGPETSTSNRCTIGGMVGNNACGAHSLVYGSTRDHLLEVKGFLSDGSFVHFKPVMSDQFHAKCKGESLENKLYNQINNILSNSENQDRILKEFPDTILKRRNTGYAIDLLLNSQPFLNKSEPFNFCKLIAGSEGTLLFITEIKLNLIPLPPKEKGLLCIHFDSLEQALEGNLIALKYKPEAIELIDNIIINCTKDNIEQRKNRFFIEGNPGAIILVEFAKDNFANIEHLAGDLEIEMRQNNLGYHFPLIKGNDIAKVWALRKAALGLLSNMKGEAKPVSVIEDTAVNPVKLPHYIREFKEILKKYELTCVFHAHVATGELHLRPVLNLKEPEDQKKFRSIATEIAHLVKKFNGSLSGEHGDGRLRGEFIPIILGDENYQLLKEIKKQWDPENIFNPGKITDVPAMDQSLRYIKPSNQYLATTYFDYSDSDGFIQHIERCNGSGDCRKTEIIGGVMCPTFMATKDELATTRARANALRELYTNNGNHNKLKLKEVKKILDLCISCKGCKSECPSNVDMAKLKAEFLQHYYDKNGTPFRTWLVGHMPDILRMGSRMPSVFNFFVTSRFTAAILKFILGFSNKRQLPRVNNQTVENWCKQNLELLNNRIEEPRREVLLFIDEFTNYIDAVLGIKAIKLLNQLNYKIKILPFVNSGRTYLSKGMVSKAKKLMFTYVNYFKNIAKSDSIIIGIEPSAVLTLRDEFLNLTQFEDKTIQNRIYLFEEFIASEIDNGQINSSIFKTEPQKIALHSHCYTKVLSDTKVVVKMLQLPKNYEVTEIKSGCCGMAGAFGYEKKHYDISMKIGELALFSAIRKTHSDTIIAANGTSCRQQIHDGTGRKAYHPIEILYDSLNM